MVAFEKVFAFFAFGVVAGEKSAKELTQEPAIDATAKMQVFAEAALEMGKSTSNQTFELSTRRCDMNEPADCNFRHMSGPTRVYPSSAHGTVCLTGEQFAFLVKPGSTNKLLFYFPGGGACWKGSSSNAELCPQDLEEGLAAVGLGEGVSADRRDNFFADWTIVAPAYCDGGAFISDGWLPGGKPMTGYLNTKAAYDWVRSHFDTRLSNFVIAGSSAGALGTMAWSHHMLDNIAYTKGAVIVDSFMGVFPGRTQGPMIKNFGACDRTIFSNFKFECDAGQSTIQDVFDFAMQSHPDVAFAMIEPKGDLVQIGYYAAIAITYGRLDLISANSLYERTNAICERYDNKANFVHYVVDGSGHTFMTKNGWFSANTGDSSKPSMVEWAHAVVEHQAALSLCNGPLERNGGNAWLFKNTRYCYQELFPKSLFR